MLYRLLLTVLMIMGTAVLVAAVPYEFQVVFKKNWDSYRAEVSLCFFRGQLELNWGPYVFDWRIDLMGDDSGFLNILLLNLKVLQDLPLRLRQKLDLLEALSLIIKNCRIKRLHWHTELGMGDPAATAVSIGVLWSLKGWLCSSLLAEMSSESPGQIAPGAVVWSVHPNFKRRGFRMDILCHLRGRLSGVMVPIIRLLLGFIIQGLKNFIAERKFRIKKGIGSLETT